jgi:hypothetical protein
MLIGRNARPKAYIKPPYKGCVVVQGPTHQQWLKLVRDSWDGYQIIFSTWENTDRGLYNESDIVIYNPIPSESGTSNLNLQKISTINGFLKAKELGWNRALKVRSDFSTKVADGFFGLFDTNKLNLHAYWNGYVTDFFMEGEIDDIITLFEVPPTGPYPEWNITNQLYKSGLNTKAICILDRLKCDDADIVWLKTKAGLSAAIGNGLATHVLPEKWP